MTEVTPATDRLRTRLARLTPEQRAEFDRRIQAGASGAAGGSGPAAGGTVVPRRDPSAVAPLSFGQERLWFVEQLQPGSGALNEFVAVRLTGPLSVAALERSIRGVVSRHESLRTVVAVDGGRPVQRVLADPRVRLTVVDADGLGRDDVARIAAAAAARPMSLDRGPLFRAALFRVTAAEALLVVTNHHIVGDAWSRGVLVDEIVSGYAAALRGGAEPAPPPVQYRDWAAWQRAQLTDEELADDRAYWLARLADAPPVLQLATDRPRPASPSHRGARVYFGLGAGLSERVDRLARAASATPFMVLLAAWKAVLLRWSGQSDVVVGTPVAGRTPPETERLIGMFVNSLVLRTDLSGDPTFSQLLGRVRQTVLGGLGHDRLPFERLVRELRPVRDLSHAPLFQVQFGLHNVPLPALALPGVTAELVRLDNGLCRFDLAVDLSSSGDGVTGVCEYSRDLFDEHTVQAMVDAFREVLRRATADPETALSRLIDLTGPERSLLDGWNATGVALTEADPVLAGLARQVRARPDAVALVSAGERLTYRELDARVAAVAGRLAAAGAGPGTRVGLCLTRTTDLVVAMLGTLRAGAAYVPLDPAYPPARLAAVAGDAALTLVATHAGAGPVPALAGVSILDLDHPGAAAPVTAPPALDDDSPAYVIYTSGSTGQPKGVVVTHGNLTNLLAAMDRRIGTAERATWLAVTSASFDISVVELLWTLSRGHQVILAPDQPRRDDAAARPEPPPVAARAPEFSLFYFASSADQSGPEQYRLLLDGARFADAHDFAAVWLPERHFHRFGGPFPAPSVLAAAVAATTRRIGIRAGSVVLPLHHPARVAEEWSVVDNLSGGRVGLSFASGWHVDDFVFAPDSYQRRHEVTFRDLDLVRRLWRGERVGFPAPGDREALVGVLPRPVQPELPTWLTSAGSVDTCRTAGRLGVGLLTHLLGQSVAELAEKIDAYREAWRAAGHPGRGWVTLMLHTFVGRDAAHARAAAWQPFRGYLSSSLGLIANLAKGLGLDIRSADFSADDREALLDHACARYFGGDAMLGTVDDGVALAGRLSGIGVDEIACLIDFGVPTDEVLASLPALAEVRRRVAGSAGGAVVAGPAPDPAEAMADAGLAGLIREYGVTHLQCTPSQARALLAEEPGEALRGLRVLLLGGEALDADLVGQLRKVTGARMYNMYGPTETTVWSTADELDPDSDLVTIGRPLANTVLYVLDRGGRRVPVGVPGELYIGGAGVAAGYFGRPDLTRDRFRPDPFRGAGRVYRTGDLVRFRRDGRLEYLGREDHQVKLRGFRVELGEVEAALAGVPGVRAAAAAAHGLGTMSAALTAYVVPDGSAALTPDGVRSRLAATLPGYLVASRVVVLDTLPLTPNGKLDRAALPPPGEDRPELAQRYEPPSTGTEERIAAIWRALLGIERIGAHDDFFELGGHSILAAQVVARIRAELAPGLPLRAVFEASTVAGLARVVDAARSDAARSDGEPPATALPPAPAARAGSAVAPASFGQQRLYLVHHLQRGRGPNRNVSAFRMRGPLDVTAVRRAIATLVARHDVLRTVLRVDPTGDLEQVVLPDPAVDVPVAVLDDPAPDGASRRDQALPWLAGFADRPFDLEAGPVFRTAVLRLGPDDHLLGIVIHHVAGDGWALEVVRAEFAVLYSAFVTGTEPELPDPPVRYADFARWQRDWLASGALATQLDYWRGALAGLQPFEPPDGWRPSGDDRGRVEVAPLALSRADLDQLTEAGRSQQATLFMVLLAALVAALVRRGASPDLVVATPVAGRAHVEFERVVGFFVNTLPLRLDVAGDPGLAELVARARATTVAALAHQDVPFEKIVEAVAPLRARDRQPLAGVMLVLRDASPELRVPAGVAMEEVQLPPDAGGFDLMVDFTREADGGLSGYLVADPTRIGPAALAALANDLRGILTRGMAHRDTRLSALPVR